MPGDRDTAGGGDEGGGSADIKGLETVHAGAAVINDGVTQVYLLGIQFINRPPAAGNLGGGSPL